MHPGSLPRALHHAGVLAITVGATGVSALATCWAWRRDYGLADWEPARFGALLATLIAGVALSALAALDRLRAWRGGRWTSVSGAPFRITAYTLVLGAAVVLAAFQPFHKYFLLLNLGLQAGVLSLVLLVHFRRPTLIPPRLARALDRLLLVICGTAVLAEGSVRALALASEAPIFDHGQVPPEARLARHRFEAGRVFLGTACDARGFHEIPRDLAPGERLVACVGDSFSVGVVPHYYHYTTVAERALPGVEIDNIGVNACGPPEYNVLLAQEALPREPDAILYAVFIGNDVLDSIRFRPEHRWARWIYDRDFMLSLKVIERLGVIAEERSKGNLEARTFEDPSLVPSDPVLLAERFPWTRDHRLELATFSRKVFRGIEASRASQICDPQTPELYADFFEYVDEARGLAGATPFLVLLIPDEFQVEDGLWEWVLVNPIVQIPLERDLPQARIGAWLDERGIPYLDLLPRMRAVPALEDGDRHLYTLRDTHLNTRGNQVAGEALAEFLAERLGG